MSHSNHVGTFQVEKEKNRFGQRKQSEERPTDVAQLGSRILYYSGLTGVWGPAGQGEGQSQVSDGQAKELAIMFLRTEP